MAPHPDFAIAVARPFTATTTVGVNGQVVARGWWVDPGAVDDPDHVPAGTLCLVIDDPKARPMWNAQDDIASTAISGGT